MWDSDQIQIRSKIKLLVPETRKFLLESTISMTKRIDSIFAGCHAHYKAQNRPQR